MLLILQPNLESGAGAGEPAFTRLAFEATAFYVDAAAAGDPAFDGDAFNYLAFHATTPAAPEIVTVQAASPVASGGGRGNAGVAIYDDDWSSFRAKKKKKKLDTDGPPVIDPAPQLERGPPKSTAAIVRALLREPSPVESAVLRDDNDDDDEDIIHLLMMVA